MFECCQLHSDLACKDVDNSMITSTNYNLWVLCKLYLLQHTWKCLASVQGTNKGASFEIMHIKAIYPIINYELIVYCACCSVTSEMTWGGHSSIANALTLSILFALWDATTFPSAPWKYACKMASLLTVDANLALRTNDCCILQTHTDLTLYCLWRLSPSGLLWQAL